MKTQSLSWVITLALTQQVHGVSLEWVRQMGTAYDDISYGVSADGLGNVYITGLTEGNLGDPSGVPGAGAGDAFAAKYDAAGNLQWIRQFGTGESDGGLSVSADKVGGVYVTGFTHDPVHGPFGTPDEAFVSRYDDGGNLQWTKQIPSNAEVGRGISSDGLGNVYVTGDVTNSGGNPNPLGGGGPTLGGIDTFVAKYDAGGNLQWMKQLGTAGIDYGFGIAADGQGNVYISGETAGDLGGPNAGGNDAFVAKYDAAGNQEWVRQWGTSKSEASYGVATDRSGNVYIAGGTGGTIQFGLLGGAFVSKYDAAGNLEWTRQLSSNIYDTGFGVSSDGFGNVYISGQVQDTYDDPNLGKVDAFVAKYDADGNLQWYRLLATTSSDTSFGVSADQLGNLYISGVTSGSLGGPNAGRDDVFVAKFSDLAVPEPSPVAIGLIAYLGMCLVGRQMRTLY